jgi:glycosyltransferase involved in cell wall biosynthesis
MDGDLQDDPQEIPRFLARMDEGFDLVSGWKKIRHDPPGKTLPSKLFNRVTALVTGVPLHDFNCGFKAYDRRIFEDIRLYGELHRFVPALADHAGYRVGEIAVTHHPRRFGRSKYGVRRLLKGSLDLLTVLTITKFSRRPGHLFGGLGAAMGLLGGGMMLYLIVLWFMGHAIGDRPLLILAVLLMIVGLQFLFFGMIAELLVNIDQRSNRGTRSLAAEIMRSGSARNVPAAGSS